MPGIATPSMIAAAIMGTLVVAVQKANAFADGLAAVDLRLVENAKRTRRNTAHVDIELRPAGNLCLAADNNLIVTT